MDVVCLGELLIDFISTDQDVSISESSGFRRAAGGAPANVAAGVARLGYSSGFIGKVGNDPFGAYLKGVLDDLHVDNTFVHMDREARTTLSFVAVKSDGRRDCMFYRNPGADMLLSPDDISEDYIGGGAIFHFGSISLGSSLSRDATIKALEYARKHRRIISYDPNLRMDLWPDDATARKYIRMGFGYADIVKISEEEHEFITGLGKYEDSARRILEAGPRLVVVTLGENGCYYTNGSKEGKLEGFRVETVETTGAGDAFVASMLVGALKCMKGGIDQVFGLGGPFVGELVRANAAGALATTKPGAIPSLPTTPQIDSFISSRNGRA